MKESIETMIGGELEAIAGQVAPDPAWTATVLARMHRHRLVRRRLTLSGAAAGVAIVSIVVALLGGSMPTRTPPAPANQDGLVDVGGRRLQLSCSGTSDPDSPTVLLDADLGASPRSYGDLPDRLASGARICTYDRAGTGASDAATSFPRTAEDLAKDLAALMSTGRLGDRVLLVSTGFSALSATVFASEHPRELAGLVLLDPVGPDVAGTELKALGDRRHGEPALVSDLRSMLSSDVRSENGEHVSWSASEAQARGVLDAPGPAFGDLPVAVLWAGGGRDALPPLPRPMRTEWWTAVRTGQKQYAAESSAGRLYEVDGVVASLATEAPHNVAEHILQLTGELS